MTNRIAIYWHNGRSLGHTVRCLALGQALLAYRPDNTVVGITGSSRYYELLPPGMDILKIPSFLGYDEEGAIRTEAILSITKKEFQHIRENLLATFVHDFRPQVLIIDYNPQGKSGELLPAIIHSPTTKKVLGLRGILDSFAATNAEFFHPRMVSFIQEHFSAIHVYTDPRIFSLEDYYHTPPEITRMLKYTGYVTRPTVTSREEARTVLNIDRNERVIVVSFGGGQGTERLWEETITALTQIRHRFDTAYLVAGPHLEVPAYERLRTRIATYPTWHWCRMLNPLQTWMKACDLFIGAGGYNTLAEVITTGTNALIIPRQLNEQEQAMHAERLAALGIVRFTSMDTFQQEHAAKLLETCLLEPYPAQSFGQIATDGALQNARLIETLIHGSI